MRTEPIATIDLATLAGLRAYPLGEILDVRQDGPDFLLQGGVIDHGNKFAYSVSLRPGLNYRFSDIAAGTPFGAMGVDAGSGEVLWANAGARQALGLIETPAGDLIWVAEERTVLLVVEGTSEADAPFAISADASPIATDEFPVYRFLNKVNGQHFFTAWEFERDHLLANAPHMEFQGASFFAADAPLDDFIPVYRFANLNNGSYFYSASDVERQVIQEHYGHMRFEGVGFYAPGFASDEGVPVYRLANLKTGGYLYTSSLPEKAFFLLSGGWRDEGFAFNAIDPEVVESLNSSQAGMSPMGDMPLVGMGAHLDPPAGG